MEKTVAEILVPITGLSEYITKVLETALIELMKATNTPVLLFCGYTPYFNDGDMCAHRTMFFGVPATLYKGWCCTLHEGRVSLTSYLPNSQVPATNTWPPEANAIVAPLFEHLLGTNCIGSIRLLEDGTLQINDEYYNPE